jgi:predicted ATPase
MLIRIDNWGPIESCEYDVDKNLIVTYGINSIGKSYAMQIMYLLLKYLIKVSEETTYRYSQDLYIIEPKTRKYAEYMIMQFVNDDDKKEEDITQYIVHEFSDRLEAGLMPELEESFKNTFGNYSLLMKGNPTILVVINEWKIVIKMGEGSLTVNKNQIKPIIMQKMPSDFHKSQDSKTKFTIYVCGNKIQYPLQLIEQEIRKISLSFAEAVCKNNKAVYYLPASRSGIYAGMSSFAPVLAEIAKYRGGIRSAIQIPNLSEPISDYYMELSSINNMGECEGLYGEIVDDIEKEILKGKVEFDYKTKNLIYVGEDLNDKLEMQDTSSMIAEISPIVAYLKFILNDTANGKMSVLFIEEPEAHVHPSNQIKLAKVFAKLIRYNVKLVLASHSNYIFNEFNNLVIDGQLNADNYEPIVMYIDENENTKSISEYIKVDEFGADDKNFIDAANFIYDEREELIDKYMKENELENSYD